MNIEFMNERKMKRQRGREGWREKECDENRKPWVAASVPSIEVELLYDVKGLPDCDVKVQNHEAVFHLIRQKLFDIKFAIL